METRKGSLKPGYLADIVVLSGDIETTPIDELHHIRPLFTFCGGKITYEAKPV